VIFGAQVRTQTYAYPLFAAILYVLAADSRAPSRRAFWCIPLLVLWANMHGSVTLGAGLVGLRGVTIAWERRGALLHDGRAWIRPLAFVIAPAACLFATPYGFAVASYYSETLLNGGFRSSITEWQPVTSVPFLAVPFFLLAAVAIWSFGRHVGRTTLWERCALIALAVGGVTAVRNVDWFAIAALMIMPISIDQVIRRGRARAAHRPTVNIAIAGAAVVALAVSAINALTKPARSFEPSYQTGSLRAIAGATNGDPSL
jgi:hypothetical protein